MSYKKQELLTIREHRSSSRFFGFFVVVLLCVFTFRVSSCDVRYDFRIKRCSVRLYLQLFVGCLMSYSVSCVCLRIVVSNTYCVVFLICFSWSCVTGTCFIKKRYAPSSSLLQGKHLPFSPSPLRFNIFRLFVILSLTQLYCYTPEIFLFSTATFKYTYRAPLRRIGQE